jgi:hypothetical protein
MFALIRLTISGVIAFVFYATWAYFANSLVSDDPAVLLKAALVQGGYSGAVTLVFTFLLEYFYHHLKDKKYCLPFVVPTVFKASIFSKDCATRNTFEKSLEGIEKACNGMCLPGTILTPLPAIVVQASFVILINIVFETPNLWLTVAPSIFFSAVYGLVYSVSLNKKLKRVQA